MHRAAGCRIARFMVYRATLYVTRHAAWASVYLPVMRCARESILRINSHHLIASFSKHKGFRMQKVEGAGIDLRDTRER